MTQLHLLPFAPPAPIYRWVGGKGRLLPAILARMPADFGAYYEPCFGAGSVFYGLSGQGRIERAVLADASPVVAGALLGVQRDPRAVIAGLAELAAMVGSDALLRCRDVLATPVTAEPPAVAAALIAHQGLVFNGLWRVNRAGRPNAAWGRTARGGRNRVLVDPSAIHRCHLALQAAAITRAALCQDPQLPWPHREPEPGDLVYIDPPYLPPAALAGFQGYTTCDFTLAHTQRLAAWAVAARARGVHVVISGSDTDATAAAFGLDAPDCPWRVDRITRSGSVSCDTAGRQAVGEVILW